MRKAKDFTTASRELFLGISVAVAAAYGAPIATISAGQTSGTVPFTVTFDGSKSKAQGSPIVKYAWDFGDGNTVEGGTGAAKVTHTYVAADTYTIILTVTDGLGAADEDSVGILANAATLTTAGATAIPDSGPPPLSVFFDGRSSTGKVTFYVWDFGDGSGTRSGDTATYVYKINGTYTAKLIVFGESYTPLDTATLTIKVGTGENKPPTAAAIAEPKKGYAPLEVKFDGSHSTDEDGEIVGYQWGFGEGSTLAKTSALATSSVPTASHVYKNPGTYTVILTVTDNGGATDSTTLGIVVLANAPPTAIATAEPDSGAAPLAVVFDGSGSENKDSGDSIAKYVWSFGDDDSPGSGAKTEHVYSRQGTYIVVLTVYDNAGASDTTRLTVTVEGGNTSPTAVVSAKPTSGTAPLAVSFDGSASRDPDGSLVSYHWDFGDGTTDSGATRSHTYMGTGSYRVVLTVVDEAGATDTANSIVSVTGGNAAPTAAISASPTKGVAPLDVTFNGSGSSDADGSVASYAWDFGDGSTGTGVSVTHRYTTPDSYTVTLRVTDNAGATAAQRVVIAIGTPSVPGMVGLAAGPHDTVKIDTVVLSWYRPDSTVDTFHIEISMNDSTLGRVVVDSLVTDTVFVFTGLQSGSTYYWKISAHNQNGWGAFSQPGKFFVKKPATAAAEGVLRPAGVFRFVEHAGGFSYVLPGQGYVSLTLSDAKGRIIWSMTNKLHQPGIYAMVQRCPWPLGDGLYILKMSVDGRHIKRRVIARR